MAHNPVVTSVNPTDNALQLTLKDVGADLGTTAEMMKEYNRVNASIGNADRPSNLFYRMNGQSFYWNMYALMDWYRSEVSILSMIILRSVQELFRYDLELRPKFLLKCCHCGYESQTLIDECPICHHNVLRGPDESQKKYFCRPNGKSFIDEANDNGQSLKDVLMSYAESQYQNNQAYLLCVTGDVLGENGKLEKAYPLEFISYDPKFVKYLYDDAGRPGRTYGFVRSNRHSLINMTEAPDVVDLQLNGEEIYPAAWQIGSSYGGTGEYWLYTEDEIYQDHWFRQSLTYGIPHWFDIEDDLLTYHYIEKHNLKKYKYGYVRKILVLPGFNDDDVELITKGIQDILAKNDNSIPILCTPPQLAGVAEMHAQALELGTESSSDLLAVKKEIMDRCCAMGGVPNLVAGDVEASGGMNNESQQITIFDRYLLGPYNRIDRACRWITSWVEEVMTDWELVLMRPSKAYTDVRRTMDRAQLAGEMKQLGYDQVYRYGQFWFSEEPIDQIQRKQQEAMMEQQMMMQSRGLLPGDGYGPPEKGTARREDADIGATEDDIDLAKREAEDNMAM